MHFDGRVNRHCHEYGTCSHLPPHTHTPILFFSVFLLLLPLCSLSCDLAQAPVTTFPFVPALVACMYQSSWLTPPYTRSYASEVRLRQSTACQFVELWELSVMTIAIGMCIQFADAPLTGEDNPPPRLRLADEAKSASPRLH
jgi:hypothetical protein